MTNSKDKNKSISSLTASCLKRGDKDEIKAIIDIDMDVDWLDDSKQDSLISVAMNNIYDAEVLSDVYLYLEKKYNINIWYEVDGTPIALFLLSKNNERLNTLLSNNPGKEKDWQKIIDSPLTNKIIESYYLDDLLDIIKCHAPEKVCKKFEKLFVENKWLTSDSYDDVVKISPKNWGGDDYIKWAKRISSSIDFGSPYSPKMKNLHPNNEWEMDVLFDKSETIKKMSLDDRWKVINFFPPGAICFMLPSIRINENEYRVYNLSFKNLLFKNTQSSSHTKESIDFASGEISKALVIHPRYKNINTSKLFQTPEDTAISRSFNFWGSFLNKWLGELSSKFSTQQNSSKIFLLSIATHVLFKSPNSISSQSIKEIKKYPKNILDYNEAIKEIKSLLNPSKNQATNDLIKNSLRIPIAIHLIKATEDDLTKSMPTVKSLQSMIDVCEKDKKQSMSSKVCDLSWKMFDDSQSSVAKKTWADIFWKNIMQANPNIKAKYFKKIIKNQDIIIKIDIWKDKDFSSRVKKSASDKKRNLTSSSVLSKLVLINEMPTNNKSSKKNRSKKF